MLCGKQPGVSGQFTVSISPDRGYEGSITESQVRSRASPWQGCVPPALGRVTLLELWELCPQPKPGKPFLTNCLSDNHQNKCLSVNTAVPGENQHKHAQTGIFFPNGSVRYGFTELWLPGFGKMNTSTKHKRGKEKITRPADSGSAQRVMSRGIVACTEKPARAST